MTRSLQKLGKRLKVYQKNDDDDDGYFVDFIPGRMTFVKGDDDKDIEFTIAFIKNLISELELVQFKKNA